MRATFVHARSDDAFWILKDGTVPSLPEIALNPAISVLQVPACFFRKMTGTLSPMFSRFKNLMLCLAALAVGMVQIFGIQVGYLCGCTGQVSAIVACEAAVCHPTSDCERAVTENCADTSDSDSGQECPDKGDHAEVRAPLIVTQFNGAFVLPLLVLSDVPPALHLPDFDATVLASLLVIEKTEPPEHGSPPMPQLVAQTIVMLV